MSSTGCAESPFSSPDVLSPTPLKLRDVNEIPEDSFGEEPPDLYEQEGPGLFGDDADDPFAPATPSPSPPPPLVSAASDEQAASLPPETGSVDAPSPDSVQATVPATTTAAAPRVERPDAPLALYRRYRPQTFAEIIGQEHVTEPLQRALVNNKVTHAYLFSGPRGCGKTTSARILARALNCEKGPIDVPCGECDSCRGLGRGGAGTVDVIEIDAASHGGVNEARDLRERAFFSPVNSRYKIYIIDEAHMVTKEGFNALLKVVEEPPPHVKFIFATTEPDKVLGTIRSRTHHYPFRLVPPKVLGDYLREVCDSEKVSIEPSVLPLVVRAGGGSVRDSLSVLDQLLGGAGENGVTYAQATGLLGFTPDSLLDETVDAISAGDASGVFAAVEKVMDVGQDPRRFAEDLLRRFRDLLIVSSVPEALSNGLIAVSDDQAERLKTQAAGLGPGELTRGAEVIATGLTDMRGTTAPRLHLELILARVLLPGADVTERGIHARLDRVERRLAMLPADAPASAAPPAVWPTEETSPTPAASPVPAPTSHPDTVPSTSSPAPSPTRTPPKRTTEQGPAPVQAPSASPASGGARVVSLDERREAAPAAPVAPASTGTAPHGLTTSELRNRWPEVLAEVKKRRRFTWILLSQNAQVADVADNLLTLDISNPGARDSFGRGGSDQVLRDALVEILGVDLRIRIAEGTADVSPAAVPAATETAPVPARSQAAQHAREAAQAARLSPVTPTPVSPPEETEDLDREDPDLDDSHQSADELLATQLGAELIGEEEV